MGERTGGGIKLHARNIIIRIIRSRSSGDQQVPRKYFSFLTDKIAVRAFSKQVYPLSNLKLNADHPTPRCDGKDSSFLEFVNGAAVPQVAIALCFEDGSTV